MKTKIFIIVTLFVGVMVGLLITTGLQKRGMDNISPEIMINNDKETVFINRTEKPDFKEYFVVNDNVDGNIEITDEMIIEDVKMDIPGNYKVTLVAVDSSKNLANESLSISVVDSTLIDTTPPVIEETNKPTIINVGSVEPDWKTYFTITDDKDGNIEVTGSMITESVDMDVDGVYIVSVVVSDSDGNLAGKSIAISITAVADYDAPTIAIVDGVTRRFAINSAEPDWKTYFTATDSKDGAIVITDEMITTDVDMNFLGVYLIAINLSDSDGNKAGDGVVIEIVEEVLPPNPEAPSVTLINNPRIFQAGADEPAWNEYFAATDNVDGEIAITDEMVVDNVDMTTEGTYIVKVELNDSDGNVVKNAIAVTVIVQDNRIPPEISVREELSKKFIVGSDVPDWTNYFTATDEQDGDIEITSDMIISNINMDVEGVYVISVVVGDSDGNLAGKSISVHIEKYVDKNAPSIIVLDKPTVIEIGSGMPDFTTYFNVIDARDGEIVVTENMIISDVNINVPGSYVVTIFLSDSDGNVAGKSIGISVYDPTDVITPVINVAEDFPKEIYVGDVKPDFTNYVTVTDNVDGNIEVTSDMINDNIDLLLPGVYVVLIEVFDSAGNSATKAMQISVAIPASEFEFDTGTKTITNYLGADKYTTLKIPKQINNVNVENIGAYAFQGATIREVIIPNTVINIGEYAFDRVTMLEALKFESVSSLISIGDYSFYQTSIKMLIIPASVEVIGIDAFSTVTALQSLTFEANSNLRSIGNGAFYKASISTLEIPASTEVIDNNAFMRAGNLSSLTFEEGSNLKTIGEYAFNGTILESVEIPANMIEIKEQAFLEVGTLRTLTFKENNTLERIGYKAFYNTTLEEVSIPSSVMLINNSAFMTFGDTLNVVNIGSSADMSKYRFNNSWEEIGFRAELKDSSGITVVGDYKMDESAMAIIEYIGAGTSPALPDGTKSITSRAFRDKNVNGLLITDTVIYIGHYAFNNTGLQNLFFENPGVLKTIGYGAFSMTNLTSVDIPATVEFIDDTAFSIPSLTSVTINFNVNNAETRFNDDWVDIGFPLLSKPVAV